MIVTIDGPAGAGKSSVARAVAKRLGFRFLDTGAMYRAVALAALEQNVDWTDGELLEDAARHARIELDGDAVLLNGRDVTTEIRQPAIAEAIHYVADHPGIRALLVEQQRALAGRYDVVAEGRDQGTVAFPHAACKIYLTASPDERARRRRAELLERGIDMPLHEVREQQDQRDRRDTEREHGGLRAAEDAVTVVTDNLQPEAVVGQLVQLVRARQKSST